jgi:hypothetical protein
MKVKKICSGLYEVKAAESVFRIGCRFNINTRTYAWSIEEVNGTYRDYAVSKAEALRIIEDLSTQP